MGYKKQFGENKKKRFFYSSFRRKTFSHPIKNLSALEKYSTDKLSQISRGFASVVCIVLGGWKELESKKKGRSWRNCIPRRESCGNWACLERKKENLLITFKISQNLVLVPERFLGGLERFWWMSWCNHFKNPTCELGLGRRQWGHSGPDPAGSRSSFWEGMRKAVPQEREAMRRVMFAKKGSSCPSHRHGREAVGTEREGWDSG